MPPWGARNRNPPLLSVRPCPSIAELVGPLHSWLRTWGRPDCCVGRATFQLLSSGSDGMRHCRASERRVICAPHPSARFVHLYPPCARASSVAPCMLISRAWLHYVLYRLSVPWLILRTHPSVCTSGPTRGVIMDSRRRCSASCMPCGVRLFPPCHGGQAVVYLYSQLSYCAYDRHHYPSD